MAAESGWQPLAPAAPRLAAIAAALYGLPIGAVTAGPIAAVIGAGAARIALLAVVLVPVVAILLAALAWARCRRTRWRLDDSGLRVRSGLAWQQERLVPRSRVQHLDIERGPLERGFGLATLVVHTAGTRVHALRQSGFVEADAVALRDALLPAERDSDVL